MHQKEHDLYQLIMEINNNALVQRNEQDDQALQTQYLQPEQHRCDTLQKIRKEVSELTDRITKIENMDSKIWNVVNITPSSFHDRKKERIIAKHIDIPINSVKIFYDDNRIIFFVIKYTRRLKIVFSTVPNARDSYHKKINDIDTYDPDQIKLSFDFIDTKNKLIMKIYINNIGYNIVLLGIS